MKEEKQQEYDARKKRMVDTFSLNIPDRVPISPKMGMYYCNEYGVSVYEAMKDMRNLIPAVSRFLEDFDPDYVRLPAMYPLDPLETLEPTFIRWPGPDHNLSRTSSFQLLDETYLLDDEFDEFLLDPTHFILTKLLPRKSKALKGFRKLYFRNPVEQSFFFDLAVLGDAEVKESLYAAVRAGEAVGKWLKGLGALSGFVREAGYPLGPTMAQTCPFDMFSDNIRGLITTITDIKERPDTLDAVLDVMTNICVERTITSAKARNVEYVMIPLHAGVDEFMSNDDYLRFYWKGLKAMIMAIVEAGMTPFVFCEGKYNSRLEILSDVPRGKVVYLFEQVDMARAKKTVGRVACICGNLSNATLVAGTKQETVDECKRLLDVCAPGGGFVMDCSIVLDNAKRENLEAMFETTRKYGVY